MFLDITPTIPPAKLMAMLSHARKKRRLVAAKVAQAGNRGMFAWLPGTLTAALSVAAAATWRHLIVRRELARAEQAIARLQQQQPH